MVIDTTSALGLILNIGFLGLAFFAGILYERRKNANKVTSTEKH